MDRMTFVVVFQSISDRTSRGLLTNVQKLNIEHLLKLEPVWPEVLLSAFLILL